MNGVAVGEWRVDAQGRHTFRYGQTWIDRRDARPISLSMPLQPPDSPYRGAIVESFFDNLLPDGIDIRRRVQRRVGAASTAAFDLLAELGRDCVGAVQLLPAGQDPDDVRTIQGAPLDEAGVAAEIRSAVSTLPLGQRDDEPFLRITLAGAQEKTALLWHEKQWHRPTGATPTTHIVKLPLGRVGHMQADLSTSVENEWLCAQIVRQFGLPVAECEIGDFEDQHVLIVERFDRKLSRDGRWWLRLPQEDMCQATGTPPDQRYESDGGPGIAEICSLLLGSRQAQRDRRNFFKAQVVFWMLCAIDGHAKNFSLFIEPHGRYTLTPLYDVMSAYPILGKGANRLAPQKARMAMAVVGKNRHYKWMEIQPRHWLSTAASVGLQSTIHEDIHGLVSQAPAVVNSVSGRLPAGFPEHVAGPILDGLLESANRLSALE
ncbi:MAG TPA: type II toxin-antitoxin system HipA family toxin [Rhodothermales bacterium]|nr:type II toxin-antitoxin system HipA family toxin [Rhodothermales bacterium]